MSNYVISRHINNISLNPREFVLDEEMQTPLLFPSKEDALDALGLDEDELEDSEIYINTSEEMRELGYFTEEEPQCPKTKKGGYHNAIRSF